MHRIARIAAALLAALALGAASVNADGIITDWTAHATADAKAIWMMGGMPIDGDSCSTDTSYTPVGVLDDMVCCSASVAYGNAGSCTQLYSVVNIHNLLTSASVSTSIAWANLYNEDVLAADATFQQVAQIAVDSGMTLHLTGSLEATPSNDAVVRVESGSGVVTQHAASWPDVLEIDDAVALEPGQYQLILFLDGAPSIPDFRAYWGEAALNVSAILTPAVSAQAGLEPVAWARIKALYR